MSRQTYRVPVREMVKDAVHNLGGVASFNDIKQWVWSKYGSHVKNHTLECHISLCCVNISSRTNYAVNKKPRKANDPRFDFLYKLSGRKVELHDPFEHGWWEIERAPSGSLRVQQTAPPLQVDVRNSRPVNGFWSDLSPSLELSETEKDLIVKSRIGQGLFREKLLEYWGGCSVTGIQESLVLRAAHIKPWKFADNAERLDSFNGLLLIPNLDLLFDRGFITFSSHGNILLSPLYRADFYRSLNITSTMQLRRIDERHLPYLRYHQSKIFRTER